MAMNRMEPTLESVDVATQFRLVLERIRAGADMLDIDDVGAWDEDERVRRLCLPILYQHGLSRIEVVFYGSFLREMSKLMRRKDGDNLALALDAMLTKWSLRRLDPALLKTLICHSYSELSGRRGIPP
jgi:hypothetical protein